MTDMDEQDREPTLIVKRGPHSADPPSEAKVEFDYLIDGDLDMNDPETADAILIALTERVRASGFRKEALYDLRGVRPHKEDT